jgi:nitrite reductase/ring-hydroxylating ferredoxin subunit
MSEIREVYTVKEGKVTLREYVICSNNKHRFEVKNGSRVVYEGESYQQAKALYQELSEKKTAPAKRAVKAVSIQPKRRLRPAFAEAS